MDSGESFCDLCTRLGLHDTPLIDIIEEIDRLRTFIAEKDKEIERLNEHLAEKDNEISDLKRGDELYRKWVEDTQKWLMR
jgi:predicted RNase H-like nuclease (RuvC/YqgF family)